MFQGSAAKRPALVSSGASTSLMSQVRTAPRAAAGVDFGGGDGSATRWLGTGDADVVDSRRWDGSVASGVAVTELGEGIVGGAAPCWSASPLRRSRGARRSARPVSAEVLWAEGLGAAVCLGDGGVSWSCAWSDGLPASPLR
ncbi:hypothetical protein C6376_41275 [Streptomyces sp. P3]|nr:hypothetical protein C6376_41275 [Streptomyces sp. P3]